MLPILTFHQIRCFADPRELVSWLNDNAKEPSFKKVALLLSGLNQLLDSGRQIYAAMGKGERCDKLRAEHFKLQKSINEVLRRYKVCPQVVPPIGPGMWVTSSWIPANLPLRWPRVKGRGDRELAASLAEVNAVMSGLTLAAAGRLDRVRRCKECQRWLYARVPHQSFCSLACQQRFYRSSEDWKAHRRVWMKDYRQLKDTGSVK